MVEHLKDKIYTSLKNYNQNSKTVKIFDINIFDVNYHTDKSVKNKLKEVSDCQNFISICCSTDSIEKRATMKEFVSELEKQLGYSISHVKNLMSSNHFYIYFEYKQNFIFDVKVRKKLISKSVDINYV